MGDIRKVIAGLNSALDSGLSRVSQWVEDKDIATISAFRKEMINCRKGVTGEKVVKATNLANNRKLKAALLKYGYGVTKIDGVYVEGGQKDDKENSFLVVNLVDDPKFAERLSALSERFCQDSVFIKLKGEPGYLYGTNNFDFPGYHKKVLKPAYHPGREHTYMSKVRNRPFHFDDFKENEFAQMLLEHIVGDVVLESWDSLQPASKHLVALECDDLIQWVEGRIG